MTTKKELLTRLENLKFVEAGDKKKAKPGQPCVTSEFDEETAELEEFIEQTLVAEAAGALYADCRSEVDYVLEGGDPKSAISTLMDYHPGMSIDRDELQDHPAQVIAQHYSDELNSSRIQNRKDPVIRAPKSFF